MDRPAVLGFIGLGVMGSAQCAHLVADAGLPVQVFDLDEAAMAALVEQGATPASGVQALAASCDVVFLSLPSGEHVDRIVTGEDGIAPNARAGATIVDLSTSPVSLARRLGPALAERGIDFVDAPVSRTRQAAVDGTLSITAGGERAAFDRVLPYLELMASDIRYCGTHGAGALVKLVNNLVVFETVVALSEALALVRNSGIIDVDLAFDALAQGSAASFTLEHHGRDALLPDEHAVGRFSSAYMRKDIGYNLDLARELGLELPAARLAHDLLGRTIEAGGSANYHTAVSHIVDPGLGPIADGDRE